LIFAAWAIFVLIAVFGIMRGLPRAREGLTIAADPIPVEREEREKAGRPEEPFFDSALKEKIVFMSLLSIIFAQMLSGALPSIQLLEF
jgi:hypothetical protein